MKFSGLSYSQCRLIYGGRLRGLYMYVRINHPHMLIAAIILVLAIIATLYIYLGIKKYHDNPVFYNGCASTQYADATFPQMLTHA